MTWTKEDHNKARELWKAGQECDSALLGRALDEIERLKTVLGDPVSHIADWVACISIGTIRHSTIDKISRMIRHYGTSPVAVSSQQVIDKAEGDLRDRDNRIAALTATITRLQQTNEELQRDIVVLEDRVEGMRQIADALERNRGQLPDDFEVTRRAPR